MFKKGDVVKLKAVIPQGPITKMRMDDDGNIWYLMEWTTEDGQAHSRWFMDSELEAVE
jgi:sugar lactone lactonase YvrE